MEFRSHVRRSHGILWMYHHGGTGAAISRRKNRRRRAVIIVHALLDWELLISDQLLVRSILCDSIQAFVGRLLATLHYGILLSCIRYLHGNSDTCILCSGTNVCYDSPLVGMDQWIHHSSPRRCAGHDMVCCLQFGRCLRSHYMGQSARYGDTCHELYRVAASINGVVDGRLARARSSSQL